MLLLLLYTYTTYNSKLHLKNLFSCFFSLICVSFLLFFFHLYYIIFLTFGEKKISSCFFISFLSASIFLLKSYYIFHLFFFLLKKLVSTLYYTQYVIVLYTIILLSARRLNFLFLFFHRKKIRTDRPSLLTYIDYILFHFAGNLAKVEIGKHIFSYIKNVKPKAVFWLKHFPKY